MNLPDEAIFPRQEPDERETTEEGGVKATYHGTISKHLALDLIVDAAELHLGESLHLTDIQLPEGVQIVALTYLEDVEDIEHDDHNVGVLSVFKPRAEVEPTEEEEVADLVEGEEAAGDEEAGSDDEGEPREE